jgi:hypothetical protein
MDSLRPAEGGNRGARDNVVPTECASGRWRCAVELERALGSRGLSPRCAETPLRLRVTSADNRAGGKREGRVLGKQPTNDAWRVYYERADEVRAVVGDPFKRHIARETLRERILMAGSLLFVLATIGAFCLFTMR